MTDKICGIYCIENKVNGKKYIGRSIDIMQRFANHKSQLRLGKHINIFLQRSWNKYGKDSFIFYILKQCSERESIEQEKIHIKKLNTRSPNGYNSTDGGEGAGSGMVVSEETRKKISKSNTGRVSPMLGTIMSNETKKKISKSKIGTIITDEVKKKISDKLKGMFEGIKNPMFGVRGKDHPFFGKTHSEESKGKMSDTKHKNGTKRNNSSSKYIGVSFSKRRNRWESTIYYNSKKKRLGYFVLEIDAARAYDKQAVNIFGKDAKLNFPNDYEVKNES
jgi:group I intron endonuclease